MSKYSNYRIRERERFYVQKKNFFGWHYIYNWEKAIAAIFISACVFLLMTITMLILYFVRDVAPPFTAIAIQMVALASGLIATFWYKNSFELFEDAKLWAEKDIIEYEHKKAKKKEIKDKIKNSKIHYLDLRDERKNKLMSLK